MLKTSPTPSLGKWRRFASPAAGEESAAVSHELAAAVLPHDMLHGDEIILLLTKPSPLFICLTSFRFIVTVVLLAVLAVRLQGQLSSNFVTPNNLGITAALLSLGRLIWGLLVWTSHTYMLTNQRIVTIKGVLNVAVVTLNLRKVQRTNLYRPFWMRLFGLGTIGIATAATETLDATWVLVSRPIETHEAIVAAIRKVQ